MNYTLTGAKTDYTKFCLAILIIALHTELLPNVMMPILRVAVPLFFIISAYFFFKKVNANSTQTSQILHAYLKRNINLYLFWTIIQLPVIIIVRDMHLASLQELPLLVIKYFFWYGTFPASWFILALIIGIPIIVYASRRIPFKVLFSLSLISYAICCISTNYFQLLPKDSIIPAILIDICPENSVFTAFIWIMIGKGISEGRFKPLKNFTYSPIIFSLGLIYMEYYIINHVGGGINRVNDCYFSLIPLCIFLTYALLKAPTSTQRNALLGNISTITYCCHFGIYKILYKSNELIFHNSIPHLVIVLIVFTSCIVISFLLIRLSKKYSIFKYAL